MLVSTTAVAISHNWIRRLVCYFVGYEIVNVEMESAVRKILLLPQFCVCVAFTILFTALLMIQIRNFLVANDIFIFVKEERKRKKKEKREIRESEYLCKRKFFLWRLTKSTFDKGVFRDCVPCVVCSTYPIKTNTQ